jgi:hypothetical protein
MSSTGVLLITAWMFLFAFLASLATFVLTALQKQKD